MTNCTQGSLKFPAVDRKVVEADFKGGTITSDGGVLLLRDVDAMLGLSKAVVDVLPDPRDPDRTTHSALSLLRQRLYGLALGYEDLNDHTDLRRDWALQTAVEESQDLASAPTLCRWENRASRSAAVAIHKIMVDQFIASYSRPPRELILDFDATDDAVHGRQDKRFFHGYYDKYCFLPLYVFCGDQLLVSYLRPSNIDGAHHAWAILALLVKRLRQQWPDVRIILRGDSGFCRHKMLSWCERQEIDYIIGIAKNKRLNRLAKPWMEEAQARFEEDDCKHRVFGEFSYAAGTWKQQRRVIIRAEHGERGSNPRYIVTTLKGKPQSLYDEVYCARGDMENRIKEQQLDLFADRTSCHRWWPNQFRLLLSSLAYILLEGIQRLALQGTRLARVYVGTLRLRLLKVGAVIVRNTRRVRFLLSSSYPYQDLFRIVAHRLRPG